MVIGHDDDTLLYTL